MYKLNESEHIRDRKFEIILQVNPVVGSLLTGGHPDCLDEIVRVNLLDAVKQNLPVLSGVIRQGRWVDAWRDDGFPKSEKHSCLVYEGHVESTVGDEAAEEALNHLATNLGSYLQSPKIRVSIGERFWVFSRENERLTATM